MYHEQDIPVTYSNGALRPDEPLQVPENARMRISIRRIEVTAEQEALAKKGLAEIRRKGVIRLGGWRPSRDELYERG